MTDGTGQVPEKKGGGCWKAAGVGCLVVLVALGVGGFLVVKNRERILRSLAAKGTEVAAEGILGNSQLPESEREAAMVPIREFAAKIKSGEVSMDQAKTVGKALAEGPLPMIMMARAAELMYLEPSELPAEEKEAGRMTLSRFARAITQKKVAEEKINAVFDEITIKTTVGDQENVRLKETLTTDELREWLKVMKDAADEAGIENRKFVVDIEAEIRKAIDAGMGGRGEVISDR